MDWIWASGFGIAALGALTAIAWFVVELLAEVDAERIDLADS